MESLAAASTEKAQRNGPMDVTSIRRRRRRRSIKRSVRVIKPSACVCVCVHLYGQIDVVTAKPRNLHEQYMQIEQIRRDFLNRRGGVGGSLEFVG